MKVTSIYIKTFEGNLYKLLSLHNFIHHYFNRKFLIEFKFYNIVKTFIRILTLAIFFKR